MPTVDLPSPKGAAKVTGSILVASLHNHNVTATCSSTDTAFRNFVSFSICTYMQHFFSIASTTRFARQAFASLRQSRYLFLYRALQMTEDKSEDQKNIRKWANQTGEFVRKPSSFRMNWISGDGSTGFKAEAGRYHLYVSYACPWAHRTLITRQVKGLSDVISVNVVDYLMGDKGWRFNPEVEGATPDTVYGCSFMREIYFKVEPNYEGRFTVPVLFDKQKGTIVSNESSEIIRMLNSEFNAFCATDEARALDLYPANLKKEIDEINEWIYPGINNGVYRAGFATTQFHYDKAVREVFAALDRVEEILSRQRYLTGSAITEADIRLYTTLVRFDTVYVGHFKVHNYYKGKH
jgi:putative glutathione S-transferase